MKAIAAKLGALALRALADELDGEEAPAERRADRGHDDDDEDDLDDDLDLSRAVFLAAQPQRPAQKKKARAKKKAAKPKAQAKGDEPEEQPEAVRLVAQLVEKHGDRATVAERFGFAPALLGRWARGATVPSPGSMDRLRAALKSPAPEERARDGDTGRSVPRSDEDDAAA